MSLKTSVRFTLYSGMDDKSDFETDKSTATHNEFLAGNHVSAPVPQVTWWRHPGLRKLYIMMPILFLGRMLVVSC
jgi:hypothetical protein